MATKNETIGKLQRNHTDRHVEALDEFGRDPADGLSTIPGLHADEVVAGLFLYVGPRTTVWRFRQRRKKRDKSGRRPTIAKTLGTFPEIGTDEARNRALALASDAANDKAPPSKRTATTFETAWGRYLQHLEAKANANGKPARHHANAMKLGNSLILPQWGKWTLLDMSNSPDEVEDWHAKMTRVHGPVSANRAAELIRAAYKRHAKRDTTLSFDRLPTSAVEWNKEEASQNALDPADFPKWRKAWDKLESDVHRGYFLFCLLSGVRPGEGARIQKQGINRKARTFTIPNAKAGKDIVLPMTKQMEYAIDLALNAPPTSPTIRMKGLRGMKKGEVRIVRRKRPHHEIIDPDLVFPGCRQMPSRSGLPVAGQALRHTYKTLHVGLGISETLSKFLMAHALEGVSPKYIAEIIVLRSAELRAEQEKISKHIFKLLGLTVGSHHDAPLVPKMSNRVAAKARA
jgi:integrase